MRQAAAADARRSGALLVLFVLLAGPIPAQNQNAQTPPPEMHVCWTNCFTLILDKGLYRRADGTDETWTVERFTPTSVILRRHDAPAAWNGLSADVTYQGRVSNDQLINVTVDGRPVPDIGVTWGFALNSLPGSNAERDRRTEAQAGAEAQSQAQDEAEAQALAMNAPRTPGDIDPAMDMSADAPPPPLLNYEQTPLPEDGYLWTPGYWGWSALGYYWVPGAWVQPPRAGVLWTPGYWAFAGAVYVFHPGYWGPHVGYYGGINYGYGYTGSGFAGGRWVGNAFAYNRAVSNVNAGLVHHAYSEAVVNQATVNKVSYSGGPGGTSAIPTAQERAAAAEAHMPATPRQRQIVRQSAANPDLMAREFVDHSVVAVAKKPAAAAAPGAVGPRTSAASAVSAQHNGTPVRPSSAVHPQGVTQHSPAPDSAAHSQDVASHVAAAGATPDSQGEAARPATVKRTVAAPPSRSIPSSK